METRTLTGSVAISQKILLGDLKKK